MKKIIIITFASLLITVAAIAKQDAPAKSNATHKTNTEQNTVATVAKPVVHTAEYNKRAAERANRTNPKSFNKLKKTAATKK